MSNILPFKNRAAPPAAREAPAQHSPVSEPAPTDNVVQFKRRLPWYPTPLYLGWLVIGATCCAAVRFSLIAYTWRA